MSGTGRVKTEAAVFESPESVAWNLDGRQGDNELLCRKDVLSIRRFILLENMHPRVVKTQAFYYGKNSGEYVKPRK